MAETGSPSRHATTVTSNTTVQTNLRFDPTYVRTFPGILKCIQPVSNLLAFIFIEASGALSYQGVGSALNGISMFGFWCTLILLIFYLFHIIEKFYKIPWIKFEMVYCLVMAILFLIVSPLALQFNNIFYQIGAVFGFISMVVYAIDAFLKFRAFRSGRLAQGERVVTKTTTTY